jgi:SNF2 family DNA or RNA helicase
MAQKDRDNSVRDFQENGGLLVATYGALAEGVTLTAARAIVLHDLDWKMSTILQAEARIHRLGQTRGCMSTWMIAEDSIDVILARALLRKAEVIEQTLGIDAPAKAVDELELSTIAGYTEMEAWARDVLERWVS